MSLPVAAGTFTLRVDGASLRSDSLRYAPTSGSTAASAKRKGRATIDRTGHYASWTEKVTTLLSSVNPVASSNFGFSAPAPMGVVGMTAPEKPSLLGLVSHVSPVIVSGNTAAVLLSEQDALPGLEWAEALATSDLPGGVINLLSGHKSELVPHLARHMDVNTLSLTGLAPNLQNSALQDAAVNVKRTPDVTTPDYFADPVRSLDLIRLFVETKTTWHPVGW